MASERIYITKYALNKGIIEVTGVITKGNGLMRRVKIDGEIEGQPKLSGYYHTRDIYTNKEDAISDTIGKIKNKMNSHLEKVRRLKFIMMGLEHAK